MNNKYKVGSLFAGVGGICLGFSLATYKNSGYEIEWANEIDKYACSTYRNNFTHKLYEGDILYILNPNEVNLQINNLETKITKLEKEVTSIDNSKQLKSFKNELLSLKTTKTYNYYKSLNNSLFNQRLDILTGGFPCQAFSIAGGRQGFNDARGNLFWSFIHIINGLDKKFGKPRILLLENVKNLKTHDNGNTYKVIKLELEKLGMIYVNLY